MSKAIAQMDGTDQALVIDLGSDTFKVGFANQGSPQSIFPSTVTHESRHGPLIMAFPRPVIDRGSVASWDDLEQLLQRAYTDELHVDPSQHSVVLIDDRLSPVSDREKLIQIQFETFNVASFQIWHSSGLCL
jgi:actin beta/gamma 1